MSAVPVMALFPAARYQDPVVYGGPPDAPSMMMFIAKRGTTAHRNSLFECMNNMGV